MALILAVNNGAFATLGFIGVNSPGSTASAASGVVFVDYAQCSNDAPPSTSTACPGGWINGILNTNNSHYHEGDVTPQRAEVSYPAGAAITGSTLTFRYETKKGGVNAYDSLATWNFTQTTADRNQGLLAADIATTPLTTFPMASDATAAGHELPAANRLWTMYGGTLTGTSAVTHDCTTPTTPCTGDDYATVTVTYNVAAGAGTRNVQLLFGGHLAVSVGALGWGPGLGSSSVSGGPYHIKWDLADGASIGNRDNQIMSGAVIATPALSISKSGPATATLGVPFSYTLTVSNTGTGAQAGVSVSDTVPTGLTINGTPSSTLGTCSVSSQVVTCNLGTVNAGTTVTITINVTATAAVCGSVNCRRQW